MYGRLETVNSEIAEPRSSDDRRVGEDLKTYVTAAATGMLSLSGFVWLVTDALGRLGVLVTYGAGTLLISECRQSLSLDSSTKFGGVYVPAENTAPTPTSTPTSPASGPAPPPFRTDPPPPPGAPALSTSPHARGPKDDVSRPTDVWSEVPYAGHASTGAGSGADGGDGGVLFDSAVLSQWNIPFPET
jgi:hypothetical protein